MQPGFRIRTPVQNIFLTVRCLSVIKNAVAFQFCCQRTAFVSIMRSALHFVPRRLLVTFFINVSLPLNENRRREISLHVTFQHFEMVLEWVYKIGCFRNALILSSTSSFMCFPMIRSRSRIIFLVHFYFNLCLSCLTESLHIL